MARSLAPYIHVILADVVSITLYINKPLVRLTTAHYQSAVSMISFAQVLTAQWSDTIPKRNVQFSFGITSLDILFQHNDVSQYDCTYSETAIYTARGSCIFPPTCPRPPLLGLGLFPPSLCHFWSLSGLYLHFMPECFQLQHLLLLLLLCFFCNTCCCDAVRCSSVTTADVDTLEFSPTRMPLVVWHYLLHELMWLGRI